LRGLFTAPAVQHVHWGAHVVSLRDGRTLFAYNAPEFLIPASNQKTLTVAAAAERLGWDYRFTTRLMATGPIVGDGVLDGDLVIVGDGDPTINPRHPDRWGVFDRWVDALEAHGLKAIRGNVIGDDNRFDEPGWGVGWAWDNLQDGYGAPVGALQYHENQVEVIVGPGLTAGAPGVIATSPIGSGLDIVNKVLTVAADGETAISLARVPGTPNLHVRGQIAASAKPVTTFAAVQNPTEFYLEALRGVFLRHGIEVIGAMTDIDDLLDPPDADSRRELLVDRSPPLSEVADVLMKWSRNGYAETLLHALAPGDQPATGTRGMAAMREALTALGLGPDGYLARDGSGLSRYDYVSAESLTRLLAALHRHAIHAAPFRATLPVAGISGTLASRMKGTPAEGRVLAKTGTLSNVRSIAGYLTTAAGEPIAFAFLANNFQVSTAEIDAITDNALVRLVESGVTRDQSASSQSSPQPPPELVIQAYGAGLSNVRAANPDVRLHVGREPEGPDEPVLFVDYPAPTADPAARDVQCDADTRDWSAGRAIAFQIKPAQSLRLSVSFLDRHRVVYTAWRDLTGGVWQQVRIPFDEIRPNPFFQPPGADTGAPLDVTDVRFLAFAPQDKTAGRLAVGKFVVTRQP
jgi:D-alanyl-D-alanine carboxypeptidase/D-alanyl-D-alanine-endopeptidase (penicillin-binding protein 4)